ncbi:MAG: FAD-dependent oxidoreductase [Steroidobacteraceae bacterium]
MSIQPATMTSARKPKTYPYTQPPEIASGHCGRYPVAIVGAGPVGLSAAIDLATRGIRTVLLDDNDTVSAGSRAICWSKRTLEILDRLGVAERMLRKGGELADRPRVSPRS